MKQLLTARELQRRLKGVAHRLFWRASKEQAFEPDAVSSSGAKLFDSTRTKEIKSVITNIVELNDAIRALDPKTPMVINAIEGNRILAGLRAGKTVKPVAAKPAAAPIAEPAETVTYRMGPRGRLTPVVKRPEPPLLRATPLVSRQAPVAQKGVTLGQLRVAHSMVFGGTSAFGGTSGYEAQRRADGVSEFKELARDFLGAGLDLPGVSFKELGLTAAAPKHLSPQKRELAEKNLPTFFKTVRGEEVSAQEFHSSGAENGRRFLANEQAENTK